MQTPRIACALIAVSLAAGLEAQTVPVAITTSYSGLSFYVDSRTYNSLQQVSWTAGSPHEIGAHSPQYFCGGKFTFSGWSNGGLQTQAISAPSTPTTYIANYKVQWKLDIAPSPPNGGSVSVNTSMPEMFYPEGATVQVSATPAAGYVFAGWSGDYTGTSNPLTIEMNGYRIATAIFTKPGLPKVTLVTNPSGNPVEVDGAIVDTPHTFEWASGSAHSIGGISQSESGGYRYAFSSWSDGGAPTHTIFVTSPSAVYTANLITQVPLTTNVSPATGGYVTRTPETDAGWAAQTSTVRLTAVPLPGFRFDRWSGDTATLENPTSITMDVAHSVTALFTPITTCAAAFARPGASISALGDVSMAGIVTNSQCAWIAGSDASWVTFPGTPSGSGKGTLRFTIQPNPTNQPRNATISLAPGITFPVSQAASPCPFTLSSQTLDAASTASNYSVGVIGPGSCQWAASASSNWITPASPVGLGDAALNFSLAANNGATRTGSITVASQTLKILQKGAVLSPPAFTDVASNYLFFDYIQLLSQSIVSPGCSTAAYCPEDATTRAQMALLIIRSLYGDAFTFNSTPFFSDVPSTDANFKYIQKMKELGITSGCTETKYCPQDPVTRGQMAVFLVRAGLGISSAQSFPSSATPLFTDVPANHIFFSFVQKLREMGITGGCSARGFCPDGTTTRGQMAVFLIRSFFTP